MDTDTSRVRLRRLWKLADQRDPEVWWRHDVDYDLSCAVKMAALEKQHGVVSTYFFLTQAYPLNVEALEEIVACGHEIAPHVDLHGDRDSKYTDADLFDACQDAYDRLTWIYRPVSFVVSFHQPPRSVIGREIPGFESAQGPEWQGCQTADSRGVFHVSPEEILKTEGDVQINLHPEWWFWPKAKQQEWRLLESTKP